MNRNWVKSAFGLAALAIAMAPATITAAQAQGAGGDKEKVLVRFTWQFKGEHAPLFVALDKGYYADEGLDVQLAEGSGAETVVKVIAQGIDNIGFGPAPGMAEAIGNGLPLRVVAVYQAQAPMGLMSYPDIALKTPKDLEGHSLGLTGTETFAHLWEPFAKLNGVDLSKVTKVTLDYASRNGLFVNRKIDFQSTFLNVDVPLMEKKLGIKFNTLKVADFGLKVLGDCIFVNRDYAKTHAETIRKLLRATAKGFRDAQADPHAAAVTLGQHLRVKLPDDLIEEQLRITLADTLKPADKPLGWQDPAEWQSNVDLLKQIGVIKGSAQASDYFTNEYLVGSTASRM